MEFTTLTLALIFGLGLLGADSVMSAGSVEVEVAIAPKVENISVDEQTLAARFKDQLDEITSTASIVRPQEIRSRADRGSAWRYSTPSAVRCLPRTARCTGWSLAAAT